MSKIEDICFWKAEKQDIRFSEGGRIYICDECKGDKKDCYFYERLITTKGYYSELTEEDLI